MTDNSLTDQEIDLLAGASNSNYFVARVNALADVVERIVAARAAQAWDEGWRAAQVVTELDGVKVWAHTVTPDGYEGNPHKDEARS